MTTYNTMNRVPLTTQEKREKIKALAIEMLEESHKAQLAYVEKALNSGGINIDEWSEHTERMIIPKSIIVAALESEAVQYDAHGTSFERRVKKNVKNIRRFI